MIPYYYEHLQVLIMKFTPLTIATQAFLINRTIANKHVTVFHYLKEATFASSNTPLNIQEISNTKSVYVQFKTNRFHLN